MKKLFIVSLFVFLGLVLASCSKKESDLLTVGSPENPRIIIMAGKNKESSNMMGLMYVKNVISDEEIVLFNLQDQQLKEAIGSYFGKKPNDAYLKSPTPWGDLYEQYHWNQVERVSTIINPQIVIINVEEIVLKSQNFTNLSDSFQYIDIGYSIQTNYEVIFHWNNAAKVMIENPISFSIDYDLYQSVDTAIFNVTYNQTNGYQYSRTIGATGEIQHSISPNESIIVDLVVNKYHMIAQFDIESHLIGFTVANYNPTYRDYHFWGFEIGQVMSARGIKNNITSTIQVELIYFDYVRMDIHN
jgi:hypothetical protein